MFSDNVLTLREFETNFQFAQIPPEMQLDTILDMNVSLFAVCLFQWTGRLILNQWFDDNLVLSSVHVIYFSPPHCSLSGYVS